MSNEKLLEVLKELVPDKYPRMKLDEYNQGFVAGQIAIIDYIENKINDKERIKNGKYI